MYLDKKPYSEASEIVPEEVVDSKELNPVGM
jgi:hypothetical protein